MFENVLDVECLWITLKVRWVLIEVKRAFLYQHKRYSQTKYNKTINKMEIKSLMDVISLFYNKKINKNNLVRQVYREYGSYNNLKKIEKKIPSVFKGIFYLSYLKRKSYKHIFKDPYCITKGGFIQNIGVLLFVFEYYEKEINDFIKLQQGFECAFMNGRYDEAKFILESINNISYSLWAAKCEIKLARLSEGINSSINKYNSLSAADNHVFFNYICDNALKTSEVEYALDSFINTYNTQINRLQDDNFKDFLISHCCPFRGYGVDSIIYEFGSSIIDLYIGFQTRLNLICIEDLNSDQVAKDCLAKMNNIIEDPYLKKYCLLWGIASQCDFPYVSERIAIIESYYQDKYHDVTTQSLEYLEKNPTDITILDLYVKSVLRTSAVISKTDNNESISKKIIYYYYLYFKRDESPDIYLKKLYTICNAEYMILGLRHLWYILRSYQKKDITHMLDDFWRYSYAVNLRDVSFFDANDHKESFFNANSYTILKDKINMLRVDKLGVKVDVGFEFLELQILGADAVTSSLIKILETRIVNNEIPSYMKDKIASFLFDYYISIGNIYRAVNFFVEEKLKDEQLFNAINNSKQLSLILDNRELEKKIPLELSIFHTIIGSDTYKRYVLYKCYVKSIAKSKASDIIISSNDLKLKYFLSNVVDQKVLGLHVVLFKSSNDVLEERVSICKNLFQIYNEKRYSDEIEQIVKEQTMKGLIKRVDESKIFVDEESLVKNELDEENKIFEIYRNTQTDMGYFQVEGIADLLASFRVLGLDVQLITSSEDMINQQKMVDYKYSLFHQLYLNIRDKFLTSPKSGLDYYLSTRIRHGTLVNQLRHHFQKYRLITNIADDEEYVMDSYWTQEVLLLKDEQRNKCSEIFLYFTKTIDKLILTMKDEYVQIKTESINKEKQACFDFSVKHMEYEIHTLFTNIEENDEFSNFTSQIILNLWLYTECCLDLVKNKLELIRELFLNQLSSLEKNVIDIIGAQNPNAPKLTEAIAQCRTAIQSDINTVSNWFQRKYTIGADFTIQMAIDTSIAFINKINLTHLAPIENIESNTTFKGEYFSSFHDMFYDIFNNILGYCKRKHLDTGFEIKVSEIDNMLVVEIINPINDEDVETTLERVNKTRDKCDTLISKGISRGEGNSGIAKIYNVVMNILGDRNNQYEMSVNEGKFVTKILLNITHLKL